uniref:(California timema) hypothetical protein n=2 Tax=Timema californicum TaxID=61474 RepID=A0A7R9JLY5_TIMCA|nr:unnamed protein product [Timema californicum]
MLEATNSSTIAIVVRDALRVQCPSEINNERFSVLLTNSATYMLKAAKNLKVFYAKLIHVVQTFDEEQAVAIIEANAAISCSSITTDLAYVKINFGNLLGAITVLEARDLPLVKAVKIIRGIEENLNQFSGYVGTAIVDKLNRVL